MCRDNNYKVTFAAKIVFLPVMNFEEILHLICWLLQAVVIAIANEGERIGIAYTVHTLA